MTYATASTKYQVVIPKEIRRRLHMKPRQKFIVWEKGGVLHLVPVTRMEKLEGIFRGMDISGYRDEGDRV